MANDDFEWDDKKAAANLVKHNVSFVVAREAFDDPLVSNGSKATKMARSASTLLASLATGCCS
jgi:uncharacterized DUF497 family protein